MPEKDSKHNMSMSTSRNIDMSLFPELNKSISKMDDRLRSITGKISKVYLGRKDEFDHARSLERRKMLNKEAYELLKNNTRKEEIKLRKKYQKIIK
jgi:hypothetical protein